MYIHLHTRSYYSFLDGVLTPKELVTLACDHGMRSLALTDMNMLTGAVEFFDSCCEAGIKPILGLEITLNHPLGTGNILLLGKDITGWAGLCQLSSLIQSRGESIQHKKISFDKLTEFTNSLLCLTGGKRGLIYKFISNKQEIDAIDFLDQLKEIFQGDLFIELQYYHPDDVSTIRELKSIGNKLSIPLVATNTVCYKDEVGSQIHRTLNAIRLNTSLSRLSNQALAPEGSFFTSSNEMKHRFEELPETIVNTHQISEICNLVLPVGIPHYPVMELPPGVTEFGRLKKLANKGLKEKYKEITQKIKDRLDYEINMIHQKGYTPFFLIVKDILDYAREIGVPISSRGSAASSLVAYCLGITTPDPIKLNLYFERFLNPARSTPPDIDTDLCSKNRYKVIQYVYDRFGENRVAMVATINRFQRRSALREVSKAHGLSNEEITLLTAALPNRGWGPPDRTSYKNQDPFHLLKSKYQDARHQAIFLEASSIIGFPRHLSVHPGGIIISPGQLTDLVPTHLASKGIITTQFDLESVERLGLVKIDLLGTRGLTVLGSVAEKIQTWRSTEFTRSIDVLESIPDDEPKTRKLLKAANTIGCFAIESPGMRRTLLEIKANNQEDIMITLALYRPGPMTGGLKDSFVKRHLGREPVIHIHPALAKLLDNTYGVILYQEQVLRIASELAGLSLADSDLLRRAMSHFDPGDQMKTLRSRFIQGALKNSEISEETGEQIWELMAAFAGYGFPKAHAASYAQVAWRSAWCKAHYPAEFMAAVLAGWGGYYRQEIYVNEARRLGLVLNPPHINHSRQQFWASYPEGKPNLYMGLAQIRNLTQKTIKRIIINRPFVSLEDFLTRVDPRPDEAANLVMVGGLRGLGSIPKLLTQVEGGGWRYHQPRLFPFSTEDSKGEDWDIHTRVAVQKKLVGIGVDAHPVELLLHNLNASNYVSNLKAQQLIEEDVEVIGIRQTTQRYQAENERSYYILEVDDSRNLLQVRLSTDLYNRYREQLSNRNPIAVEGRMISDPNTEMVILDARKITPLYINNDENKSTLHI